MQKLTLQAEPRTISGKRVRILRRSGLVPAVIYGHGFDPISVQIPAKEFDHVFKEAGQSTIVYLDLEGTQHPTIIHDVAIDPVKDTVIHADLYKVRLDEKITAPVPVVFIGESPAVKDFGGILVKNINELEVEALPQDLPHEISIDLSILKNIGDHILVKDLKLGAQVTLQAKPDDSIVLVQEPISEEQLKADLEAPVAGSAEDVEVIKKEKTEEEPAEATE